MGRGKFLNGKLSAMPEPTDTQAIVMVAGTPGGNLLQAVDADGRSFLCRVPSVFRGKVWAIKGGFLLVDMIQGDKDGAAIGKVQATLVQHLYRDHIRHLQGRGLWPSGFDAEPAANLPRSSVEPEETDVRGNEYMDDDLPANTNRRGLLVSDSEDEDDSNDDADEEEGEEEDNEEREDGGLEPANVGASEGSATLPSAGDVELPIRSAVSMDLGEHGSEGATSHVLSPASAHYCQYPATGAPLAAQALSSETAQAHRSAGSAIGAKDPLDNGPGI